jgi:CelD/BcsL family acetyltransferase involved in cellulose biosynthesis
MRHAQERLRQLGTVKFYRVDTAERDQLERFYRLEASGWKGKEGSAILCNGSRPFYDQIAEDAAHFGYFSLYLLECDQRLIAGHFAFTHRGRCYSPIVAHDETFRRFGPGHLIVGEIVRDCMQRGIRCYDFTGQDQPWKMKWTTQTRAMRDYFVFKGPLGRLAHAIGVGLRSAVGG